MRLGGATAYPAHPWLRLCQVYGNEVAMEDIGLPSNKPKSILELENIIKYIDEVKVCKGSLGSVSIKQYKNLQSKFESQFIQSYDRWRHANCSTILDVTER